VVSLRFVRANWRRRSVGRDEEYYSTVAVEGGERVRTGLFVGYLPSSPGATCIGKGSAKLLTRLRAAHLQGGVQQAGRITPRHDKSGTSNAEEAVFGLGFSAGGAAGGAGAYRVMDRSMQLYGKLSHPIGVLSCLVRSVPPVNSFR
jgi:hypothetical protein